MKPHVKPKPKYIIGIDEVGRGALAGPVVVAAAMIANGVRLAIRGLGVLKDSKKLSAKKREAWFAHFKNNPGISFAVARVYPRGIERLNISQAANLAAKRACARLMENGKRNNGKEGKFAIYLDGGLFLGRGAQPKNAKTMIKADEKITAVKIASIIAKVHRDKFMAQLAKKYPFYGFEIHKGYGTRAHFAAIKKYGILEVHRKTFCDFN